MSEPIRAVDLFCGGGGLSWALVEKLEEVAIESHTPTEDVLEDKIDLVGINHDETAIATHKANHPWARHYCDDIQNVKPREIFDEHDPDVKILSGGIECTHWSTARGGKPVDEQKRMPAWDFLTFVQKLRPECVLVENVPEFEKWGKIADDGTPTRDGETFEAWIDSLHALGYNVDWDTLVAADYGDATTRKRLFIIARRNNQPEWPERTHSPDGAGDTEEWRTAADIIDWSDAGESIWGRSRPLVNNTMQRIAEGIRRHAADRLEPFADVVEELGKEDVEMMQERMVPPKYAHLAAQVLDDPFLIGAPEDGGLAPALHAGSTLPKYYGTAGAKPVDEPLDTVTSGGLKHSLCSFVLGQHSNSVARDTDERPVPTIATDGNIQLVNSAPFVLGQHGGATSRDVGNPLPTVASDGYIRLFDAESMVLPANGFYRGLHSNPAFDPDTEPLNTVKAKNTTGHLLTSTLMRYSHGGASLDTDDPLPTITTAKGGVFGLASSYLVPYYGERSGQAPRTHSLEDPCPTVTATGSSPYLASPFMVQYHGTSGPQPIDEPTPTIETRDSLALCIPDLYPWGLDIRFRMLQPGELAAAQGFPADYEFKGNKTETVEQIGNAVPVNLGKALVGSLLTSTTPSLTDFLDDGVESPNADEPIQGPDRAASDD